MNSLSAVRNTRSDWMRGLMIILGYAALTLSCGIWLLATRGPYIVILLLSIPLILTALYYPRWVFAPLWLILMSISLATSYRLSSERNLTLTANALGGALLYVTAELVHTLITARRKTERALQHRDQELAALNAVTATITTTLKLDEVIQRLVDTVNELLPQAMTATIQILDEGDRTMRTEVVSASITSLRSDSTPETIVFRPGMGVAGLAIAERAPINVADVTADPRYIPGADPPRYRSLLVAPLLSGQKVWGTLSVAGDAAGAFTPRDEHLIERLAQHAAIAIEKAHLHEETARRAETLNRRNQALTTLYETATVISSEQSSDTVLRAVAEQMTRALNSANCALSLWDRETNQVKTLVDFSTTHPDETEPQGTTYDLSRYPATLRVLESGQPMLIQHDDPSVDAAELALLEEFEAFTVLMLPLIARDRVVGLVELIDDLERRDYTLEEIRLAESLAAQAAITIENARLFERMRAAEIQYRALFEDNTDPIAVLDEQGVFLDANAAACEVLGRTHQQIVGQKAVELISHAGRPFSDAIQRVLTGWIFRYEFGTTVNERMRYFETRVERIDYADKPALQWTAHDVTARRDLDLWRQEITDIIVHNLRNPLTWVKSGVGMAQMLLPEEIDPDIVTALTKAVKGIARMDQQIDVLLNIGRAEAGEEMTDKQPLSLVDLVNDVIELLGPRATARKIQLQAEFSESLPTILGNRNMLAWALENLVDNAIKYGPPDEIVRIQVSVGHRAIQQREAGVGEPEIAPDASVVGTQRAPGQAELFVCVMDRGSGVLPVDREQIFRKYYQARRPGDPKGSGLGLYFCKLAVEAHGGRIWVDSPDEGWGSKFTFSLPL